MDKKWKKLELDFGSAPANILIVNEPVFYAREYNPSDTSSGSTKSTILNFKKDITVKDTKEWYWRNRAVTQFEYELLSLFNGKPFHLMAVPGSKPWSHHENNQRFQDLFASLKRSQPNLIIHWPIDAIQAVPSSAKDNADRDVEKIKANYKWLGFNNNIHPPKVLIIDDVLTTGAHFKATVDFLRENGFTGEIRGIFWAKTP